MAAKARVSTGVCGLDTVLGGGLTDHDRHDDADDPVVSVTPCETDSRVRVRVADTGPGTGTGLSPVSTLVEMCGGVVWLEDDPTGPVFCVAFETADSSRAGSGE